jgi:hypothetical protein
MNSEHGGRSYCFVASCRSDCRILVVGCDDYAYVETSRAEFRARSARPQLNVAGMGSKEHYNCHVVTSGAALSEPASGAHHK